MVAPDNIVPPWLSNEEIEVYMKPKRKYAIGYDCMGEKR